MRLFTLLLPLLPALSPLVGAADTTAVPFVMRIWKNYKAGPPAIDFHPELDASSGDMVINKTQGYPGFTTILQPGPNLGQLTSQTPGEFIGYMSQLETKGHYQLKGGSSIPQYEGVLYKNFTRQGQDCGGNCGGTSLKYNGKPYGTLDPSGWFVVPHPTIAGAYLIRFTVDFASYPIPAGATNVYMWASGL